MVKIVNFEMCVFYHNLRQIMTISHADKDMEQLEISYTAERNAKHWEIVC